MTKRKIFRAPRTRLPNDADMPEAPEPSLTRFRRSKPSDVTAGDGPSHPNLTNGRAAKRIPAGPSNYTVGFGRPPRQFSWQPGQSGNSRGRPANRRGEATILRDILNRTITLPINGRPKKVTILEAIFYRITGDALSGNIKSADFLLRRLAFTATADAPTELDEADQALIRDFAVRLIDEGPGE